MVLIDDMEGYGNHFAYGDGARQIQHIVTVASILVFYQIEFCDRQDKVYDTSESPTFRKPKSCVAVKLRISSIDKLDPHFYHQTTTSTPQQSVTGY